MMNGIGKNLLGCAIAVIVVCSPITGNGAVITQYPPVTNLTDVILDITIRNNDAGTIYDSALISLDAILGNVADWIIANNSDYTNSTRQQVFSKAVSQILGSNSQVCDGWNAMASQATVNINNVGGSIDITYTGWYATQNVPSQDTMTVRVGVPLSLLDINHDGTPDVGIAISTNLATSAVVATDTDGSHWGGDAYSYKIQEPPTSNLTILAIATLPAGSTLDGDASPLTNMAVQISVKVSPTGTVFALEYVDSLSQTNWGVISSTNRATTNVMDRVYDRNPSTNRFYRLGTQ